MTLSEKLTNLANSIRDVSNVSQKLSLDDMTKEVSQMSGLNNYFLTKLPVFNDGKGNKSVAHGSSQRFSNQGGLTGELVIPDEDVVMNVFKGDTITQSLVVRTDGTFTNFAFNFIGTDNIVHPEMSSIVQLDAHTYKVISSHIADKDDKIHLLQLWAHCTGGTYVELSQPYAAITEVGGVVKPNLLADISNTTSVGNIVTKSNGVYNWSNVKNGSLTLISTTSYFILKANHQYNLHFTARGKGSCRTYVFAYIVQGSASVSTDNMKTYKLTDNWQEFSYNLAIPAFDSKANFNFRAGMNDDDNTTSSGQICDIKLIDITE